MDAKLIPSVIPFLGSLFMAVLSLYIGLKSNRTVIMFGVIPFGLFTLFFGALAFGIQPLYNDIPTRQDFNRIVLMILYAWTAGLLLNGRINKLFSGLRKLWMQTFK